LFDAIALEKHLAARLLTHFNITVPDLAASGTAEANILALQKCILGGKKSDVCLEYTVAVLILINKV